MKVRTVRAEVQPMERTVTVSGSFSAQEQTTLRAKVAGRIDSILVDIGSVVSKGDPLARLELADFELRVQQARAGLGQARALVGLPAEGDSDVIETEKTAAIEQAKALLEEAKKHRNRVKALSEEKISSFAELETAEAAYRVAQTRFQSAFEEVRQREALIMQRRAELDLALKELADATLSAPFDGVVFARRASLGEHVQAGAPLIGLASIDPLRLRLEIPERDAVAIRAGQDVKFKVSGSTNLYTAKLKRVSPILNETNRMLVAEADLPAKPELRPGLFVRAEIIVSINELALSIPKTALTTFVGIEKVFTVNDSKAHEKNVVTGRQRGDFIEIVSGLKAGEMVILNPQKIRSNDPVVEEAHAEAR